MFVYFKQLYHYIVDNKVLLNKNIIHYINSVTKPHRTQKMYFHSRNSSQEYANNTFVLF